ncbi:hypothetical protein BjapCC829_46635 (plasmid) [Bradyrhizobium barranii]|uniref:Transposase IS30-like HTH domain-containing protein n=1 Tax=Bradyrhizobium barranii TaxID=2992140 RepID=A0ABY3R2Y7_9BRAD|nr:hypothetical protein [Bradyrhizobium japonicum]UFW91891.1 hypothetical protein BjapCC829_46635 [Bradyrhizobium japonicum]
MKVAKITLIAVAGPGRDDEGKTVYKTGGLTMRRLLARPWTEDEEKRLRQMAEAGMKTSLIARKLKRPVGSIYTKMAKQQRQPGPDQLLSPAG